MSNTARGVVGKINSRPTSTGGTAYSFVLKNESTWYSVGFQAPQFKEGDSIQFEVVQRGNFFDAKNVAMWESGTAAAPAPSVRAFAGKPSFGKKPFTAGKSQEEKDYWANKDSKAEETQRRIEVQAARNAAIETVGILLSNGLISVPEKIKKTDGKSYLSALINELIDEYIANTTDRLEASSSSSDNERSVADKSDFDSASESFPDKDWA